MPSCKSPGSLQTCQTTDIMLRGRKYTFSTLEFGKRKTRMRETFGPCRTRFAENLLGGRGRCAINVLVLRKLPEPPQTFSAKVFLQPCSTSQKRVVQVVTRFGSAETICRTLLQNTLLRLSRTIVGLCGSVWGGAEPNRFLQIPPAPKQVCRKPPLCLALTNCRHHTNCTTLQRYLLCFIYKLLQTRHS